MGCPLCGGHPSSTRPNQVGAARVTGLCSARPPLAGGGRAIYVSHHSIEDIHDAMGELSIAVVLSSVHASQGAQPINGLGHPDPPHGGAAKSDQWSGDH